MSPSWVHELRDKSQKLETLIPKMAKNLKAKFMVVTRGSESIVIW